MIREWLLLPPVADAATSGTIVSVPLVDHIGEVLPPSGIRVVRRTRI